MASSSSKDPLDELNNNNTETEEGTIALQRKRSRRVSFAENTSIHVFDRDEYSDNTPPDPTKNITGDKPDDEVLGFFRDLIGTENSNEEDDGDGDGEDDDDEVVDARKAFFRSIDSPSPGSMTGSATSNNDEDNFFGPVSASFIRPGRYSDSAASEDENHDLTMDSTAFSMHFRSLARSESEVDLKTPTGITELAFEQKTQTPKTTSYNHGSLMTLTRDNKPVLQSPVSAAKFSHTKDSNEMSLVDENPHRYDYAKLSPELEALLSETGHDLPSDPFLLRPLESPSYTNNEKGVFRAGIDSNDSMANHDFHDRSAEASPAAHVKISDANPYSTVNPDDGITRLSDDAPVVERSYVNQPQSSINPNRGISLDRGKEPIEFAFESSKLNDYVERHQSPLATLKASIFTKQSHAYSPGKGMHHYETDGNHGHKYQSAMPGSVPSLSTKQRQLFFYPASSLRDTRILTPDKWPGSFISQENIRHSKSMSSIHKSVSKLNVLKNSPYISSTQDGHDISRRRLSLFPLTPSFDMHNKDAQIKHVEVPIVRLEEQFSEMDQKKGEIESATNMDRTRTTTSKNIKNYIQIEETTAKSNILDFTEEILATTGTDFSLAGTLLPHEEDKKASDSPEFVSSQVKRLSKSALSPEHKINMVMDLKPQNETNKVVSALFEEDRDCFEAATSLSKISVKAHETDLEPSLNESISSQDLAQMDNAGLKRTSPQDLLGDAHVSRNLETSSRKTETLNLQLGTPGENDQIGTDLSTPRNPTKGEILSPSHHSASPYVTQLSTHEPSVKEIQSPSRQSSRNVSRSDNVHRIVHNSSGRKRQRAELVPNDVIAKIQRSPKVQKSQNNDMMSLLEHSNEINDGRVNIGSDLSLNHSSDIFSKFSAELESLNSFLADKLNPHVLGVLEDTLAHVQKVKKIEKLCADVQCQKRFEPSRDMRLKRDSETRSLVSRLIYERAKSQFLRMKRETLQKKIDVLIHATQESQSLKTSFKDLYVPKVRDAHVGDGHRQSLTVDNGAKNVVADKVVVMKQEVEASERKIKHLTEYFHTLLKVKGELSTSDTLVLVIDDLKKRTCRRLIRQDMLAWEVDDFESRNGQHNVVVNYHGFIRQRFTLADPASGIVVSSILNDANIVKKFPNMEACTAFAFMLKAVNNRKYAGKRCLAQDTQVTSSLLCNLLDVIEEVRRARLELFSLTETKFHSPSVERLDLQLVFIDLKSGHRTILTFDMSCLDCGIYPSEILPSQIQDPDSNTHTSSPSQTRLAEIKAAVDSLRVGHVRILRLCSGVRVISGRRNLRQQLKDENSEIRLMKKSECSLDLEQFNVFFEQTR